MSIQKDLISYSVCHRYKYFYDRPRMYLFTYAFDDKNANELFSGNESSFRYLPDTTYQITISRISSRT